MPMVVVATVAIARGLPTEAGCCDTCRGGLLSTGGQLLATNTLQGCVQQVVDVDHAAFEELPRGFLIWQQDSSFHLLSEGRGAPPDASPPRAESLTAGSAKDRKPQLRAGQLLVCFCFPIAGSDEPGWLARSLARLGSG